MVQVSVVWLFRVDQKALQAVRQSSGCVLRDCEVSFAFSLSGV
ncbi:hypothetical protein [Paraburkholderia saeva]|jgi:hypothetical protein|nr:hypothetical protein [Paraburkholderia saeva]